jgi:hypothetical protein
MYTFSVRKRKERRKKNNRKQEIDHNTPTHNTSKERGHYSASNNTT